MSDSTFGERVVGDEGPLFLFAGSCRRGAALPYPADRNGGLV